LASFGHRALGAEDLDGGLGTGRLSVELQRIDQLGVPGQQLRLDGLNARALCIGAGSTALGPERFRDLGMIRRDEFLRDTAHIDLLCCG
jgi:hypothetical protein